MEMPQYIIEKIKENRRLIEEYQKLAKELFGYTTNIRTDDLDIICLALEFHQEWMLERIKDIEDLLEQKNNSRCNVSQ